MSGRGRGNRRPRKSWHKANGKSERSQNSHKEKESERKYFAPQSSSKPQSATYATVKDVVIQQIQRSYSNGHAIAKCLKEMSIPTLTEPTCQLSTSADKDLKAIEQAGLDIKFQEDYRAYKDDIKEQEEGLSKAYALIFSSYCTTSMQHRIEQLPNFDSIQDDPIALLEAIQEAMTMTVWAQYPFTTVTDATRRVVNMQQGENEELLSYVKRFKQQHDVFKAHVGTTVLDSFVTQQEDYKNETDAMKKQELQDGAFEAWMALLLLHDSDQAKYGTLMADLVTQYSLGNDQFPETISVTVDVLTHHKFDQKYYDRQKRNHSRGQQRDHRHSQEDGRRTTSFSQCQGQSTVICHCCGETGHISPNCPKKEQISCSEWWINSIEPPMLCNNQMIRVLRKTLTSLKMILLPPWVLSIPRFPLPPLALTGVEQQVDAKVSRIKASCVETTAEAALCDRERTTSPNALLKRRSPSSQQST